MMSSGLMWGLIVAYVAITCAAAVERNWWRALYFIGAIVISLAVLGMTRKDLR